MISGIHNLKSALGTITFPKWNILSIALLLLTAIALTSFRANHFSSTIKAEHSNFSTEKTTLNTVEDFSSSNLTCDLDDYSNRLLWLNFGNNNIKEYKVVGSSSKFTEFPDGTALITGIAQQTNNSCNKWEYSVRLVNKRNWAQWSALGRSYKPYGSSDHTTWNYYEVDDNNSTLKGKDCLAGKLLNISHNPTNFEFGFQTGYGANVKDSDYGLSGWFLFSGDYHGQGDFNGDLDNCGPENPIEGDWDFSCQDGKEVDIYGIGIKNNVPAFIDIPNPSNVFQVVTEVVYKGGNPGNTITIFDDNGIGYTAEIVVQGNSSTKVYRAILPATSAVYFNNTYKKDKAQSLVVYAFRNNTPGAQQKGVFTYLAEYNNLKTLTFNIPQSNAKRNIDLQVPISELTPDGRYLKLKATAGGVSEELFVYGPNTTFGSCCLDILSLTLEDVPASASQVVLEIDTRHKKNGQTVNGQSYVLAGAITLAEHCPCTNEDLEIVAPSDITIECTESTAPSITGEVSLGCDATPDAFSSSSNISFTDVVSGGCPKVITRTWAFDTSYVKINTACQEGTIVRYTLDECNDDGNYNSLSEFLPTNINLKGLQDVSATKLSSDENSHSCTPGPQGVSGMCIETDSNSSCNFNPHDDDILTFTITVEPKSGENGKITGFEFFEKSPPIAVFTYASHTKTNNFPKRYGFRILKNGTEILKVVDVATTQDWTLEKYDFSDMPAFEFSGTTTFEFQMGGYCRVGNGGQISVWDLDDIKIKGGGCNTTTTTENVTLTDVQKITVQDNNDPVIVSAPSDMTVNCNENPAVVAPVFSDECDDNLNVVFEEEMQIGLCADNFTKIRTWTAEDDCGNKITATQIITFVDTQKPTLSNPPANITVECSAIPAPATLTATDNCDADVQIAFNENRINGSCTDNYTLERIWIAKDNCGNTRQKKQLITVQDTQAPTFTPVSNLNAECSAIPAPINPQVTDNCDNNLDIDFVETTSAGSCANSFTITRKWTATDNCGNAATLVRKINVTDSQAPSLSVPTDKTVQCDNIPAVPTPAVGDNCDNNVNVNFSETITPGSCTGNFTITRTWVAEDNCGNTTTKSQTITVLDGTGPQIIGMPQSMTIECDNVPAAPILTATDNCDPNPTIVLEEEMQAGVCADNFSIIRTWTATDDCGNKTIEIQVVTITDTTDPELAGIPANVTVECNNIPTPANPTASDNCDTDVTIEFQEISSQANNGSCDQDTYTLTRIWKATDNCGNTDIRQQVILVQDTQDPVLGNLPSNLTVECDAIPTPATPTATDNCDNNVTITLNESSTKTNTGACTDDTYVITRTWTATDNCGNTDTHTQQIQVQDTTDPVLAGIPANITISTLPIPSPAFPTATDNCDNNVQIDFTEVAGEGCAYEVVRTWTATDNCGNTDVRSQTITVEVDPQAGTLSIDDPLVCLAPAGNGIISATPNGDANVPVGFDVIYVLTKGAGLVIQQVNATPTFTLTTDGQYTIHTLIYVSNPNDPNFLDLSIVDFGTTTGFDVNSLLQQGGGNLCASLDVAGAKVNVDKCNAKIGDMVFEDLNGNGIIDAGEPSIKNVIVNLEGTADDGEVVFASTQTNNNGKYIFKNLVPGQYKLTFIKPIGFEAAPANEGNDEALDSDADPTTGMTAVEVLTSGETNLTYDAGFFRSAKIGDMVFEDINANGIMDNGETGISGVAVTLTGNTGNGTPVTLTTTTDNDGKYSFAGLAPGNYQVTFTTPTGFTITYINEGNNDNKDSDISPVSGKTELFAITSGQVKNNVDAGYYQTAKIGNFVFEDTNANGIQDNGEVGIGGVTVELTGTTGNGTTVNLTQTTNGQGNYSFGNLVPGAYKLTFTTPNNFIATYANEGSDDTKDSDANPTTGMTAFENLKSGEVNNTYDAGFFQAGKIGDMVFEDLNGNGIMDAGESGIGGVEITLTGTTGNGTPVTLTTTTNNNGKYTFDGLAPGEYKLTFTTPQGFEITYLNEGNNEGKDSDIDPTTSMTELITIKSGEENNKVDAGFYQPAKIGDFVFEDTNANGIQDNGENGIGGVEVELTGTTGNGTAVNLTKTTNGQGKYSFGNLVPGAYKLTFTTPSDFIATYANEGGDDTKDSDANPTTGMTIFETLVSGENNNTYDAGFFQSGKIGDMVFEDLNGNGIMDTGELGIEGVEITLTGTTGNGTPVTLTTTTNTNGKYTFDGLAPGEYKLTFTTPQGFEITYLNEGNNEGKDSDIDPATGMTELITIESGEENNKVDAGFYQPARIGDFVFEDTNANGIQDNGENGISGVEVELTGTTGNGTAVNLTKTTNGQGKYSFGNLVPGDYKLTFTTPNNFIATYANEGGDDTEDSDANPTTGMTVFETLTSGEDNDTYDAGFFQSGKIGDMVFEDLNGNGIMDAGEPGIGGVAVTLTGTTGNGTPVTLTTTTDNDGKFVFEDLAPGEYKLTFTTPQGFVTTYLNEGNDATKDSDIDPATGMTEFITIESGEENNDVDAGYYEPTKIGDMVFVDANANGLMDAGETGIQFVTVELTGFTGNNTPVNLTTQTNANGKYKFENLVPGAYKLTFTADPIYQATILNAGNDDEIDSDIDPTTGMTAIEVLTSGENNLTYDAGYYIFGKIGDFVWLDCNKDGLQSPGEAGLIDVPVTLTGTDGTGTPVNLTTQTDADGKYEFDNLIPGVYKLTFDFPSNPQGLAYAPQDQGNDGFDSDVNASGMTDDITITSGLILTDVDAGFMDIKAPTFVNVPADVTVECDAIPAVGQPGAIDNIDTDVEITFAETTTQSGDVALCENNAYTITRVWTAKDDCGNENTTTQIITVQDTTDPVLADIPANVTVECDAVPTVGQPTATDNCDVDPTITFEEIRTDGQCVDNYVLERKWTATDNCGNSVTKSQFITVLDTTDPELFGVPADVTVECDLVPAPATPVATDNCDADVVIDFVENRIDGNCLDSYTLERTWTATDNCGNQISQKQIITVQDTNAPALFDIPANVTVECDAIPTPSTTPFADDNCDVDVEITFAEVRVDGNCADNYTLERTWTATDNCGNATSKTQVITVQDTTNPELLSMPANITVECDAVPAPATPTANDNCDTDVTIDFVEVRVDGNCADNYNLERTWTATDNCGNSISQTQIITVQDTTDPVLAGVPADATVECDAVPTPATPTASDNCDTDVTIDFVEVRVDGNCTDNYNLERTWTATDNCGNTISQTQIITVQDTTDPILAGVPADTTVECDAVPTPATPTASDNCDTDVTIDFVEVRVDGNCMDNYQLERTWTATDNCGNSISQTQIITVQDTTDPVLAGVPADATVECDAVPAVSTAPTATDNCDTDVDITFAEVKIDGNCLDSYILERTWTATDNCGNTISQTQTITVQDTTNPTLAGVPADVTVECDAVPAPATPTATDNCDTDVEIFFAESITPGDCADTYVITRTWAAVDNCANAIQQIQTITVQDTTDPVLSGVPADATVECDAIPAPAQPTANDNCDTDVTIDFVEVRVDGNCLDNYTLERTWTATDNCGNTDVQTQIITVQDTTNPILAGVPADATVECSAIPTPAQPTATDNCDTDVTINFIEVRIDGNCLDNYTLERTWTATDNCGNTISQTQIITVQDTTDPVLAGVPADTTVECDAVPTPAQPTTTDNCDTDVTIDFVEVRVDGNCMDNYQLERTWTATDNCGNTISQTQTITVQDTTDPILAGVPADVTVECNAVPTPATPTATDNCDTDVTIDFAEVRIDGNCMDDYQLERTWTATDNCGNTISQTQTITVQDTTDPILAGVPADVTVECDAVPAVSTAPTATDNCDTDVDITFAEVKIDGNCLDNYILERTWTATDNCGNTISQTRTITVQDTTNPTLAGVPADVTVECDAVPVPATPTATDNCDADVEIFFAESITPGACTDTYVITRTWAAVDNCANAVQQIQTITVQDTTDPVLAGVPADVTVECDAIPAPAQPTATDNCDTDVTIDFDSEIIPGACTFGFEIKRTWTVTDNCGNTDVQTQTITVQDTSDPILAGVPADATVECNAIPTPAQPTATDNCDTNVDIIFTEVKIDGDCLDNYTLERTWTATDDCGNAVAQTQIITVQDTTNPALAGVPADVTVECDLVPAPAQPFTNDNCDTDVQVDFVEVRTDGDCTDNYTLTRTWTATDNCGNSVSQTQIITVQDTKDPNLYDVPANVTVECDAVPAVSTAPFADDNCDTDVEITFAEVSIPGACLDTYTIERTWTATDNCGNAVSQTQTITVQDTTDPTLTGVPADVTVSCTDVPAPATPIGNDNCDTDVDIDFQETSVPNGCGFILSRTWTATDNCGNTISQTQTITVDDSDPVFSNTPADATVECNNIPTPAVVTASSDCLPTIPVIFSENIIGGACTDNYTIERTWTTDAGCGTPISHTQIITVEDNTKPILTNVPADETVECSAIPAPAQPIATDNCDTDVMILFSEMIQSGDCADSYTLVRTWTAVDNCGNESSKTQNIFVQDTQAPILAGIPTDITVNCNNIPAPATPVASDNCDTNVDLDFDEVTVVDGCGFIITRTWAARDNCGNVFEVSQVITVTGSEPELANLPADVTVECNNVPTPAEVTATSDCDQNVQVDFTETIIGGSCADSYTIERTWSVVTTTGCGADVAHTQTITVEDTTDPILTGVPADATVACDAVPVPAQPIATDNCDTDVDIDFSEVSTPDGCGFILTRTWTATDNCGNFVEATQTITALEDTPTFSSAPADVTVECNNIPTPEVLTATSNCIPNIQVDFSENIIDGPCVDSYTIERTWTTNAGCGTGVTYTQIITVQDTQKPMITGVPADMTVSCDAVPAPATPVATDNCDTDVDIDFDEASTPSGCGYTITRTWTATDNCGNLVVAIQTIEVDADTPVFADLPADVTVECNNIPTPATVTATSDCLPNVQVDFTEILLDGACVDGYFIERIWTTNTGCGTGISHTQIITVEDTTKPTLVDVPADATIECSAITAPATPTATDNCDTDVDIIFSQNIISGACQFSFTIERTWTAVDNCGNEVSQTQTILVEDTKKPILAGVPVDMTINCDAVPAPATPVATDDCDPNVEIDFSEVTVPNGCGFIITRNWVATDDCGNTVEASQEITVNGSEPVLSTLPADVTVTCNNIPTPETVTATSDCLPNISVNFTETIIDGSCANTYTIERTWSVDASSGCGSNVTHTQTITVEDTQAPILTGVPADLTVDCGAVPTPAQPLATDNCDTDVDIIFSEVTAQNGCETIITRTWIAADNCGNETTKEQTITVNPDAPTLSATPDDLTVECDDIPAPATITAIDGCTGNTVQVDFTENIIPGSCEHTYTIERIWSVDNGCGDVAHTQTITVEDTKKPVITGVPANVTVECGAIPTAPALIANDNCDPDVNVLLSEVETPLACGYTLTRTWTATDACGNETTATQIITVADTGSPTIANVPADVTVECSGIPAIDPNVTAQDDCDADVMLNFSEIIAPGACQDDYTITRTWTATDNCGNTISENQIITVSDTQKPVMAGIPSDLTVDCNNVPAPATPVATDNCDTDVDIDFSEISTPVGCGAIIVRTWTARDNCGNIVEASQTITVQADDPVLSNLPTDLTVECNNIPAPATVTANSDCLGNVSVDFSENIIPGSCENNYTIERTWTAVAGCGTNILHTQTITVEDTQKPIMAGIPANLEVACGAVPTPAQPIATDNCDTDVEIIFSEIQTPLACGYELTRTWTATDNCGNSTEASQIITVQDNEDPILIGVPTDEIVNCGNIPAPATPTANDNCDTDVEIIFAETSVVNGCETIITRTWTATDDCGNETIETQTITVNPDAPTLSATPADLTVECDNVPAVADLTAFDGCSGNAVPLDFTENIIPGSCEHAYIIERTWSVTNACGDISYTQIITVQDTQQPILAGVPTDVTVECDEVPALPTVTATDNCDTDVEVIFSEANTPATCGYLLTRTWTATDACGNEVTATQVITVGDDMPPVMAGIPADITIECNNIPTPANPMAQDNCDNDVTITYSEILTPGDCQDSYLLERTWTATDACGNTTSGVQKITVQDTMDPTLIGIPNDLTVDLTLGQMIPTPPSVIGNDNCDTDVEIFFSENQAGQGCAFTLIRTWTAEDNCGNTAMATQTIEVIGGLSVTETHVDAGCGMGTGSIDLTVTGGLAPFTFTWNNGIGNVEDPTGLMAGIYEVTVTDATGCAANLTIEILGTSNIQLNISSTMVSCFGGNDGTIDLTVNGGTAPFTYNWDNGIGNIEDPTGVSAGSYNITVTDANGCTASNGVNVNQPTELGVIIYPTNVSCSGTLGSATANVTGGTMPYQYNWSNGQTTSTINNLVAGTYTLTITDAKGCTLEVFTTIVELQGLVITFDSEDVTCNGETDGSATANVSAGLPPYTYAWSNGATTAIVDNLTAGTYTVSVADNMGCLGEATVTITEPDALTLDVAATGGACNGGLGMAMANVTGGTAPYTYSWDNAVTSTTATIENLAPGTYNVTVTDANGCVTSGNTTITEDLGLGVMIDKMDVNCYLGNDGMATVAVMGGTPTFTYAWSNGETNPILSNLEAGTYTVTVTDMTGCTGTASVEIISPPQIILDVTATEVTIAGNDGTATATAIGGTIPYTYVWSNGQMTATATGLIAGTYSVTVIDANGCFAVDQVDVDNGMPLGDISIGDYVWFDADRDGIQDANEMGYNNVEVRLIVAGTDGVFGTPDDMIVATEITGNHPITGTSGYYLFENVAPSQYQIEFFLGSIPNDYQFSLPNQGNDDNLDSDADPNTGRTPIFTVTANQSNDFNLDAGLHPECDNVTNGGSIMSSQMICAGEVPDLLVNDVLPSGGSGDLEYIWLSNTTGSPFSSTNPEWTVIQGSTNEFYQPGNIYLNTFFIRCVRRAGCTNYLGESNIVSIIVTPLPTTQITQAPTTLCQSETATFEAAFAGFDATYTWDFGADANPQTANERTVNSVGYTFGGSKTVTLTVEKNGCAVTTQYTLEVTNCFNGFEFTSFKPEKAVNGTDVDITWSTKYEMDNSRFFLEYSKTGDTFRAFSMKVANGSADEENDYTSKHEDPYYGVNYYRVKYVAPSGKEVYSKVETVVFDNGSSDIKVFPNPVKKATYVEILTELQQDATIEVVDLQGKVYQTQIVSEGFRTYKVDMTDYPAGTYLIWVRYNKWRKDVERVVKVTE